MRIEPLAASPHHVATLALWFHGEWSAFYAGRSENDVRSDFRARLNTDRLPLALAAIDGEDVVGTVSLLRSSIPTHAHLTPWVGGLFVPPERRRQGIGMRLIAAALDQAFVIGINRIHIALHAGAQAYRDSGWTLLDRAVVDGEPITVLVRDLPA